MKPTFEYRDPAKLKNHLLSIQLYGESLDPEFVDAVKRAGRILEPLRILGRGTPYPEGTIISGRRRRMAAMQLKIGTVPVIVEHDLTNQLDIDEQVILSNRPNDRTIEQRAREFEKLREIERERAAERSRQAPIRARSEGAGDAQANLPGQLSENGQARDIAAEAVGLSPRTAEKAATVVQEIDKLKKRGRTKKAAKLAEKLETSVHAAYREVRGEVEDDSRPVKDDAGNDVPEKLRRVFDMRAEFDLVLKQLLPRIGERSLQVQRILHGSNAVPANGFSAKKISDALKVIYTLFERHRPHVVCGGCLGPRCQRCRGRGWK